MAAKFTPIFRFTVKGKSMEPDYSEGSKVLANRLAYLFNDPRIGDVVVLGLPAPSTAPVCVPSACAFPHADRRTGRRQAELLDRDILIIKRIVKKEGKKYFVKGDNSEFSTDSRKFGWIEKKDIIGKIME